MLSNPIILDINFLTKYITIINPETKNAFLKELVIEIALLRSASQIWTIAYAEPNQKEREEELKRLMLEYADLFTFESEKIKGYKHEMKMINKNTFKLKNSLIPEAYKPKIRI